MSKVIDLAAYRGRWARGKNLGRPPPSGPQNDTPASGRIEVEHLPFGAYHAAIDGIYAEEPELLMRSLCDIISEFAERYPEHRPVAVELLAGAIQRLALSAQVNAFAK